MDLWAEFRKKQPDANSNASAEYKKVDYFSEHPVMTITYLITLATFSVIGNIGNILVIGSVIVTRRLRTVANIFIVNLALADLCVTLVVDPFSIIGAISSYHFFTDKPVLCHVVASACMVSCVCSMWSITAIAINRYISLCRREWYERIYTRSKSVYICFVMWMGSSLVELPNYLGWGSHSFDAKTMACSYDRTQSYSYTVFFLTVGVLVPLSVVLICYLRIMFYVKRCKRDILNIHVSGIQCDAQCLPWGHEEIRLAKTLFLVFVVFLLCWTPYAVICLIDYQDNFPKISYVLAIQMAHANSSINSIVYATTNRRFRLGYKRFILCHVCRQQREIRFHHEMYLSPQNALIRRFSKTFIIGKTADRQACLLQDSNGTLNKAQTSHFTPVNPSKRNSPCFNSHSGSGYLAPCELYG